MSSQRRFLFSANFIEKETKKLNEFRQIYRDIINLMNKKKELLKFIFIENESKELSSLKSQILYHLSAEKNGVTRKGKKAYSNSDIAIQKEKIQNVLEVMRKFKIMPISVQQRVLALHPKTGELRTAKILTAASAQSDRQEYRAQFDSSSLGVPLIKDYHLIPINIQGANWEIFKSKDYRIHTPSSSQAVEENGGLTLANEIRNQMLYYKVLRDKHNISYINTLQDLNNTLKNGNENSISCSADSKNYFVKFEHTKFSDQNKKAMALLIILLERKNEILKGLSKISL